MGKSNLGDFFDEKKEEPKKEEKKQQSGAKKKYKVINMVKELWFLIEVDKQGVRVPYNAEKHAGVKIGDEIEV